MSTLLMQYDYLSAYFDFFTGADEGYKRARRIVQDYDNHPVSHWRMMFMAIQDQLIMKVTDGLFEHELRIKYFNHNHLQIETCIFCQILAMLPL